MPVIKRYPNRKLYDTRAKKYITLDGVATLIRDGAEVQVLDHATGEDLTALTLSQIIFEQEKKHAGFLPYSVLTGLIQAGGDTLGTLRRSLASPLGFLRQVDEEIERRIQRLVNQGELESEESRILIKKLRLDRRFLGSDAWPDDQSVYQLLRERGVPTRADLKRIADQLDALAAKIEELNQNEKSE